MSPRKKHNRQKKSESLGMALNAAIIVAGILLLGFIYSFSKNQTHQGVPIQVTFPKPSTKPILAKDVFIQNPIQDIKIEVLNGCGVPDLAAKTTKFLRSQQVDVVRSDNADHHQYQTTLIIQRNEKVESLQKVAASLGISVTDSSHVIISPDESLGIDVTVILGKDYSTLTELVDFISVRP